MNEAFSCEIFERVGQLIPTLPYVKKQKARPIVDKPSFPLLGVELHSHGHSYFHKC
jgi:hypothetical protein